MPVRKDLTPEEALIVLNRQRRNNRASAKRHRERMLQGGYFYLQHWVPEEIKEEARATLERLVRKAEEAREGSSSVKKARR